MPQLISTVQLPSESNACSGSYISAPVRLASADFSTKAASCSALLFFSVAATLLTEASKSEDGTYPYNSFMIPCTVEAMKLFVSTLLLVSTSLREGSFPFTFALSKFVSYSLPALCYFVSNNCMFYIIRELGPITFQITNNLKTLATGVLMRLFLGRHLSWLKWKALILLVLGSVVSQLESSSAVKVSSFGYTLVVVNSFAAGAGGVIAEKLLKDKNVGKDSIHWQNMQLYFFGLLFGVASSISSATSTDFSSIYVGFNIWAYATILSLTAAGLLVSFVLKYLDNFAKCFVAALSIVVVAVVHSTLKQEGIRLNIVIGLLLTCMALEQYNLPQ